MECENCGATTKRSSICRDCKRAEDWERNKPTILRQLFPPRIAKKLQEVVIHADERDLTAVKEEQLGLFIHGDIGTGKTLYACWLMACLIPSSRSPSFYTPEFLFTTMSDMLDDIKHSFNRPESSEEVLNKYKHTGVLLLDDIGPEYLTDWAYTTFYGIINHRYDYMLPTIITSNLNLDQIAERLGDHRIPDRIYEMCRLVPFEGKSRR